ncbi:MAG: hypothetical protein LBR44_12440 [Clostridiales Family XIII bacterium]|nr:hypothetical protein [Clostridiales Family XIII bacterium]
MADLLFLLWVAHLLVVPAALTFANIALSCFKLQDDASRKRKMRIFELALMAAGTFLSCLWGRDFIVFVDWRERILSSYFHTPVWTQAVPTAMTLLAVGLAGYLALAFTHAKRVPPLVTILAISAMYIGMFECAIWSVQVILQMPLLTILPANCILIAVRILREKALELKPEGGGDARFGRGVIARINKRLVGDRFPLWALVLAFPLLGAAVAVLVLCGQRPDDIIKGYTETSDWVLSQQVAPPSFDVHYLCTVAAQGHAKLVKPLRVGARHGRPTIVNRQLCAANAFEQLLEERAPGLHRAVRGFYDAHGLPLSRLIRTKAAADLVYILMKPLEWAFVATLYLLTVNPEERIARQYR